VCCMYPSAGIGNSGVAGLDLLDRLGPHSTGKACLYLTRLDDIDLTALEELVRRSYAATR